MWTRITDTAIRSLVNDKDAFSADRADETLQRLMVICTMELLSKNERESRRRRDSPRCIPSREQGYTHDRSSSQRLRLACLMDAWRRSCLSPTNQDCSALPSRCVMATAKDGKD